MDDVKWQIVKILARQLGVSESNLSKWKQRPVPHKWRMAMIEASRGALKASDFEDAA